MPLNARFGSFELRAIEADAECEAIITSREWGANLSDRFILGEGPADRLIVAATVASGLPPVDLEDAFTSDLPLRPVAVAPDDLAAIFYTSGSTGMPKGTMQTHATILAYVFGYTAGFGFTSDDKTLVIAPLAFTGGCLSLLIPMMLIGACAVIEKALVPERVLSLIEAERITFITQVPAIWERLPALPGFAGADLSSLRVAATGGAPVPVSLLETFRCKGVKIRQVYGCTEVGAMGCTPPVELSMRKPWCVGFPQVMLKARIVDGDGKDCPPGMVGELWMKGPQVMTGYWRNEDATKAAFEDGYFKTGDLAQWDEEGTITIVDRLKNMIISGGVNIYPAEVERALASIGTIEECGVVGVADDKWGERVVAIVHSRMAIDTEILLTQMRPLLGPLKTPREILVSANPLPKTVTNKISRRDLGALYQELTSPSPAQTGVA